jgi:hypothetical protein
MHETLCHLESFFKNKSSNYGPAIERCIRLVSVVINETGKNSTYLLPTALNLCVSIHDGHLKTVDGNSGDVQARFYELVYNILLNHWRFFVGTRIHASEQNVPQFVKLFEVIAVSF